MSEAAHSDAGVYGHLPLETIDGIPVYSRADDYTRNYDLIAEDHLREASVTGNNPFMSAELWEASEASTAALLRKYARAGDRVLDVGVGLGRLLERFPEYRRHGMDISLSYLKVARGKGIEVCMARIEDMPYRPEMFDVVLCTDVLEHVLDLNFAVERMLHALRRGGHLVIRVPYRENLSSYLRPEYPYRFAHLRSFDEFDLTLLFERVFPFKVMEHTTAGRLLDWTRLRYPLPAGNRAFARGVRLIKRLAPPLGRLLGERLFMPVVINMVVRK